MSISTVDLKDFAATLAVASSDETQLRASISRAYYAAFHAVMPFVERLPRSEGCRENVHHLTHQELAARLSEWRTDGLHPKLAEMKVTKGQLCKAINAARAVRVKADYRIGDSTTLGEAQSQVERVRLILRITQQVTSMLSTDESQKSSSAG